MDAVRLIDTTGPCQSGDEWWQLRHDFNGLGAACAAHVHVSIARPRAVPHCCCFAARRHPCPDNDAKRPVCHQTPSMQERRLHPRIAFSEIHDGRFRKDVWAIHSASRPRQWRQPPSCLMSSASPKLLVSQPKPLTSDPSPISKLPMTNGKAMPAGTPSKNSTGTF